MQVIENHQTQVSHDNGYVDVDSNQTIPRTHDSESSGHDKLTKELTKAIKSIGRGLESQSRADFRRHIY